MFRGQVREELVLEVLKFWMDDFEASVILIFEMLRSDLILVLMKSLVDEVVGYLFDAFLFVGFSMQCQRIACSYSLRNLALHGKPNPRLQFLM